MCSLLLSLSCFVFIAHLNKLNRSLDNFKILTNRNTFTHSMRRSKKTFKIRKDMCIIIFLLLFHSLSQSKEWWRNVNKSINFSSYDDIDSFPLSQAKFDIYIYHTPFDLLALKNFIPYFCGTLKVFHKVVLKN